MIDLHCHLDLYPEPEVIVSQIEREGIYTLAVTTTPRAWTGNQKLVAHAKRIQVALGLHPELVAERHTEADLLCSLLPAARYVGEIGLDGSPQHRNSFAIQERVLNKILAACSAQGGRIITLHSRAAASGVLDALETYPSAGAPVLHWFSGTLRELDRAIKLGCWFSVGPAMLQGQKGRRLVEAMPPERVLTETDGPFAKDGHAPLMPWGVCKAEKILSDIWNLIPMRTTEQLHENLRKLTTTPWSANTPPHGS